MKSKHTVKNKAERENFKRNIIDTAEESTKEETKYGTIDGNEQDNDDNSRKKSRKFFKNRLYIYIKEYWPQYLLGTVGLLALFFFVTMNVRVAEINKDVSYLYIKTEENTRKIEKLSDDVISLREQMLIINGNVKSLDDRFMMFIELFKKTDNEVKK